MVDWALDQGQVEVLLSEDGAYGVRFARSSLRSTDHANRYTQNYDLERPFALGRSDLPRLVRIRPDPPQMSQPVQVPPSSTPNTSMIATDEDFTPSLFSHPISVIPTPVPFDTNKSRSKRKARDRSPSPSEDEPLAKAAKPAPKVCSFSFASFLLLTLLLLSRPLGLEQPVNLLILVNPHARVKEKLPLRW